MYWYWYCSVRYFVLFYFVANAAFFVYKYCIIYCICSSLRFIFCNCTFCECVYFFSFFSFYNIARFSVKRKELSITSASLHVWYIDEDAYHQHCCLSFHQQWKIKRMCTAVLQFQVVHFNGYLPILFHRSHCRIDCAQLFCFSIMMRLIQQELRVASSFHALTMMWFLMFAAKKSFQDRTMITATTSLLHNSNGSTWNTLHHACNLKNHHYSHGYSTFLQHQWTRSH